jgi:hypothetical protein
MSTLIALALGALSASPLPGTEVQSAQSTHLLVVYGETIADGGGLPLPSGTVVTVENTNRGLSATGVVGAQEHGRYEAVFFSADEYVAETGDVLQVSVDGGIFNPPNGLYVLTQQDIDLASARVDVAPDGMVAVPDAETASVSCRCYPNPCNPVAVVEFETVTAGAVRLEVLDLRGRVVARLEDGVLPAGLHRRVWDGRAATGTDAPSGMYFVVLQAAAGRTVQKVVLTR